MPDDADPSGLRALQSRVAAELTGHLGARTERADWHAGRLADYQRERLRVLLTHAARRSRFHARRLSGIDTERFELANLSLLPVMNRAQLMAGFDELVTDTRLSRGAVERHLAGSASAPSLLLGDYVCLTSGGDPGERGIFVQTVSEYAAFAASLVPPGAAAIGLVGAPSPVHFSGFLAAVAAGPPLRIIAAPATLAVPEIAARLGAAQPPALLGYPSRLAGLAREQQAGRLRIAPQSVTATGELLTAGEREVIEAGFGVPVTDLYACTAGLAGHGQPGGSVLEFATDMCLAELVDVGNQPVGWGTTSAKVLITNLHNRTQPLIRYELPDRFIAQPAPPGRGFQRAIAAGRADEILRYGRIEVRPQALRSVLAAVAGLRDYQVRQTARGIDVVCVADGRLDVESLAVRLELALLRAGVARPLATVTVLDAIPGDPGTGKVRPFQALPADWP